MQKSSLLGFPADVPAKRQCLSEPPLTLMRLHSDLLKIILDAKHYQEAQYPILRLVCRRFRELIQPNHTPALDTFVSLANDGNLNLLKYVACRISSSWQHLYGNQICQTATCSGHLPIIEWAFSQGCEIDVNNVAIYAAVGGHLDILKWARSNGGAWCIRICVFAASSGNLEMLQWARENGCPWDSGVCTLAAEKQHLHILKWARANNCPWDNGTMNRAIKAGNWEILQWLKDNRCPVTSSAYGVAAECGNLEVFQWLHASGYRWDEYACFKAAFWGRLDILQWAIANGCPYRSTDLRGWGQVNIKQRLDEKGM